MRKDFEIANLSGHITTRMTGHTHIHVDGSGPFLQRPWRLNDWLRTNLLAIVAVGIHLGYLIAAVRLLWRFRYEMRASSFVLLTGHSLGGATVEVAAVLSIFFGIRRIDAVSYGGPAPWWIPLWPLWWVVSRLSGASITTIQAGMDPVPDIPPWNAHIGRREYIISDRGPYWDHVDGYPQGESYG